MSNPIERAVEQADRILAANRHLEDVTAGVYTGTSPEEYARRGDAHAAALSGGLSAAEVLEAALDRYRRDPLAHMRAELAVRVVDTQAGAQAVDEADPRTLTRAGAIVALELVERGRAAPDEDRLTPRDVLASTVVAHGAPRPVELADVLLAALERNGYAVVPR